MGHKHELQINDKASSELSGQQIQQEKRSKEQRISMSCHNDHARFTRVNGGRFLKTDRGNGLLKSGCGLTRLSSSLRFGVRTGACGTDSSRGRRGGSGSTGSPEHSSFSEDMSQCLKKATPSALTKHLEETPTYRLRETSLGGLLVTLIRVQLQIGTVCCVLHCQTEHLLCNVPSCMVANKTTKGRARPQKYTRKSTELSVENDQNSVRGI